MITERLIHHEADVSDQLPDISDDVMAEFFRKKSGSREHASALLYFADVRRYPRLDVAQEVEYFTLRNQGRLAAEHLSQPGMDLSLNDIAELENQVELGKNAEEAVINSNLRLAIWIANRYVGNGLPFLDLIQEGNKGLIRAAKKYELGQSKKFGSYAPWWIKHFIFRAFPEQGPTIRLPKHINDEVRRFKRQLEDLQAAGLFSLSDEEIAIHLEMPVEKVKEYQGIIQRGYVISLDEKESRYNRYPARQDTHTELFYTERIDMLMEAIHNTSQSLRLTEYEQDILLLRYGFKQHPQLVIQPGRELPTYVEIGNVFGVSKNAYAKPESNGIKKVLQYLHWKYPNIKDDYLELA